MRGISRAATLCYTARLAWPKKRPTSSHNAAVAAAADDDDEAHLTHAIKQLVAAFVVVVAATAFWLHLLHFDYITKLLRKRVRLLALQAGRRRLVRLTAFN